MADLSPPNGISIVFACFCGSHERDQQTDTHIQTDRATPFVAIGRISILCPECMQCCKKTGVAAEPVFSGNVG